MFKLSNFFSSNKSVEKIRTHHEQTSWALDNSTEEYGLTRVNWKSVHDRVEKEYSGVDQQALWENIAFTWLNRLQIDLGAGYEVYESDNFMLLSVREGTYEKVLMPYLESCLRRILKLLDAIASDDGYGKHVVIVLEDADRYYDYVSYYYGAEEGTFAMSGGMYLNWGYGHFVFPLSGIDFDRSIIAHEMTHALLSHLPIPLWLNEGLAVNVEGAITGVGGAPMALDAIERHEAFWNAETVAEFWSGKSFSRPDEGQELSYQLAKILVENVSKDKPSFVEFCNTANWEDAGEHAMNTVFDLSLQDVITNFLGEGDWMPNKEKILKSNSQ